MDAYERKLAKANKANRRQMRKIEASYKPRWRSLTERFVTNSTPQRERALAVLNGEAVPEKDLGTTVVQLPYLPLADTAHLEQFAATIQGPELPVQLHYHYRCDVTRCIEQDRCPLSVPR